MYISIFVCLFVCLLFWNLVQTPMASVEHLRNIFFEEVLCAPGVWWLLSIKWFALIFCCHLMRPKKFIVC